MNLRKSATHLSAINTISVILGFVFHVLLGRAFGISWELDCLFVSLTIVGFFGVLNSFFTALLLPVFNEIRTQNESEAIEFADVIFKWSLLSGILGWIIVINFSPLIIKLFASGFDGRSVELSSGILRVLFIGYIFNGLVTSVSVVLNAFYFFSIPAITGLLSPLLNIAAIFVLIPEYGIKGVAISYVLSNVFQTILLMPYLFYKIKWRPTLSLYHVKLPELMRQSAKAVIGGFIWNLREVISRNIASNLGSGAISLLSYAEKIISILLQIVVTPISGVFYSRVSEFIAESRWDEVKRLLNKTLRVNVAITLFMSAAVIVFIKPALSILFLGSRFSTEDIDMIFYLLIIELLYLMVISFETFLVRIVYSIKLINIMTFNAAIGVVLYYALAVYFSKAFGIYGLALSLSLTQLLVCGLYIYFLKKQVNTLFIGAIEPIVKSLAFAITFAVLGLSFSKVLLKDIYVLLFLLPLWILLYLTALRYLAHEEWSILRGKGI